MTAGAHGFDHLNSAVGYEAAARLLRSHGHRLLRLVGPNGDSVELPPAAAEVLERALGLLTSGRSVTLVASDEIITTTRAAELLGVSRQTVVRLIESGDLPAATPGASHRKLHLADVLALKERRTARKSLLDTMKAEGEASGLYDLPDEDFVIALEETRAERRKGTHITPK